MRHWSGLLTFVVVLLVGSYLWMQRQHVLTWLHVPPAEKQETSTAPDDEQSEPMVTITGPLADYMLRQKPEHVETLQPISQSATNHGGGRIEDSPVGTSRAILHRTFVVAGTVDVPLELPPHAATPQLRGTYHSYLQKTGDHPGDSSSEVEFLVLNQKQFSDFLNGRPGDALFSAEEAHDQELNVGLPPSLDEPVKYHLIFRNNAGVTSKKVVQADIRLDF